MSILYIMHDIRYSDACFIGTVYPIWLTVSVLAIICPTLWQSWYLWFQDVDYARLKPVACERQEHLVYGMSVSGQWLVAGGATRLYLYSSPDPGIQTETGWGVSLIRITTWLLYQGRSATLSERPLSGTPQPTADIVREIHRVDGWSKGVARDIVRVDCEMTGWDCRNSVTSCGL